MNQLKKSNKKRVITSILSAVMTLSSFPHSTIFSANANEVEGYETNIDNTLTAEGTSSISSILADDIEDAEKSQISATGCNVLSIEMTDNIADVSYQTYYDCTLVVGIYAEDEETLYATGYTDVLADDTTAQVEIEIAQMPEYYFIKAYLIETKSYTPLSEVYCCPNYTQEMQEFFQKTVDDFPENRVINFDDDKTNNFGVFGEDVIIIPYQENTNILTLADKSAKKYVFENADEYITSLTKDEIFAYAYSENDLLVIKVDTIKIEGNTVTITSADVDSKNVFEFLRIETTAGMENADIQPAEDVEVIEESVEEPLEIESTVNENAYRTLAGPDYKIESGEPTVGFGISKKIKYDFKKKDWEGSTDKGFTCNNMSGVSGKLSFSGSITFEPAFSYKEYISLTYTYFEIQLTFMVDLNFTVSGSAEIYKTLGVINIQTSIPGLYIALRPSVVVQFKTEAVVDAKWEASIGVRSGAEKIENISKKPKCTFSAKIEGSFYFGIQPKPSIELVNEKFISLGIDGGIGIEAVGKLEKSLDTDVDTDTSKLNQIHSCKNCIDGDINLKMNFDVSVTFFGKKITTEKKYLNGNETTTEEANGNNTVNASVSLFSYTRKIKDFYYSFDKNELGFTECPYKSYRVQVNFVNSSNEKIKGVTVNFDSPVLIATSTQTSKKVSELISDSNGNIYFYAEEGTHPFSYSLEGYDDGTETFNVVMNSRGEPIDKTLTVKMYENCQNVKFIVIGEDEDPIPYANGLIFKQLKAFTTNDNGVKTIKFEPGLYSVNVSANGYESATKSFRVEGKASEVVVILKKEVISKKIKSVSLGYFHSAAITEDGSLYMWGNNNNGQLGDETYEISYTPIKIMDHVASVSLSFWNSAAITEDGSLYMWGPNPYGRLGDGTDEISYTPIKIMDHVASVSLGLHHSAAITEDGSLYMWGANSYGKLGDGTNENRYTPIKIMDHVSSVSLGDDNSAAITEDGSLYMWGYNEFGQLGDGSTQNRSTPVKIMDHVASVSLGANHSAAITEDGSLFMLGNNYNGQLGDGSTQNRSTPVKIMDHVSSVSLGWYCSAAITEDGKLYMWGLNSYSQLGDGTIEDSNTPIKIMDHVSSVSLGWTHSAAITENGRLYLWGHNIVGQIGDGTTENKWIPTKITIPLEDEQEAKLSTLSNNSITLLSNEYKIESDEKGNTLSDLQPDTLYNFYVMRMKEADTPFCSANLLYINQGITDKDGNLHFNCSLPSDEEGYEIFAVPMNKMVNDTKVTIPELTYIGQEIKVSPVITYRDQTLKEGVDYELSGDVSVNSVGIHTITITGMNDFNGLLETTYSVYEGNSVILGDINADGVIDSDDAVMCLKQANAEMMGEEYLTEEQIASADVNRDGNIDSDDCVLIMKHANAEMMGEELPF